MSGWSSSGKERHSRLHHTIPLEAIDILARYYVHGLEHGQHGHGPNSIDQDWDEFVGRERIERWRSTQVKFGAIRANHVAGNRGLVIIPALILTRETGSPFLPSFVCPDIARGP